MKPQPESPLKQGTPTSHEPVTLRELEEDLVERRVKLEKESELIQKVYEAVKLNLAQEMKQVLVQNELTVQEMEQRAAKARKEYFEFKSKKLSDLLHSLFGKRCTIYFGLFFKEVEAINEYEQERE